MEIFKDIKGYEGHYQVSNLGNIKSLKRNREIILKGGIDLCGYKIVSLRKNNYQSTKTIHRLVALTFLDNLYNKLTINHINGIKTDNRLINLEWATYSENMNHSFKNGLRRIGGAHPMAVKIIDTKNGKIYNTVKEAAFENNIIISSLVNMLKGMYKNKTTLIYYKDYENN